jgi:hypothetical protein
MMRMSRRSSFAALALVGALSVGTAAQPYPPPSYPPLPPPRPEEMPPPPGSRYVWQPGHWHWNGRAYVWFPGVYVLRRPHYRVYEPGRWVLRHGAWAWVPAHWR